MCWYVVMLCLYNMICMCSVVVMMVGGVMVVCMMSVIGMMVGVVRSWCLICLILIEVGVCVCECVWFDVRKFCW